ncbi:hypothetical protein ACJX0J_019610, partial [Zea mays]
MTSIRKGQETESKALSDKSRIQLMKIIKFSQCRYEQENRAASGWMAAVSSFILFLPGYNLEFITGTGDITAASLYISSDINNLKNIFVQNKNHNHNLVIFLPLATYLHTCNQTTSLLIQTNVICAQHKFIIKTTKDEAFGMPHHYLL